MKSTLLLCSENGEEVAGLFRDVFSASEGPHEGALVGSLARALAARIDDHDVLCLGRYDGADLVGCLFFSRLFFPSAIDVFLLAPMGVRTDRQGMGIGQALIRDGIDELKHRSVSVLVTYGDPRFYGRVGFSKLPEAVLQAPLQLSMPQGWLGQSLTGEPIPVIPERPTCMAEWNNPAYW